jgi:hypothetical protein
MATTIDKARRAKAKARSLAEAVAIVTGVGLTKVGSAYAVKVNVERANAALAKLPKSINGVSVVYEATGTIKPR